MLNDKILFWFSEVKNRFKFLLIPMILYVCSAVGFIVSEIIDDRSLWWAVAYTSSSIILILFYSILMTIDFQREKRKLENECRKHI